MAITKGAKKEIRADERKAVFNLRRTRAYRQIVKDIRTLLKEGKVDEANSKLPEAYKAIDKAAKMNTIKANTASRKKSRLSAEILRAKTK